MVLRPSRCLLLPSLLFAAGSLWAQVIEFESGSGLRYLTLTKGGVTIMYSHLPSQVREFSIIQVAISNGSPIPWVIRPEDFRFHKSDGTVLHPSSARTVVNSLFERASRNDVIKLVSTYEIGLYGLSRFQSTSGYEQRRQSALAEVSSARIKAAAAASAIALVHLKLAPGESTDGAIFFSTLGKPLGPGRLVVETAGEIFDFDVEDLGASGGLQRR